MSYSPAQKSFLKIANDNPDGRIYLADRVGGLNTTQRAAAFWRTGDALARQGIVRKVDGVDAFEIVDR